MACSSSSYPVVPKSLAAAVAQTNAEWNWLSKVVWRAAAVVYMERDDPKIHVSQRTMKLAFQRKIREKKVLVAFPLVSFPKMPSLHV